VWRQFQKQLETEQDQRGLLVGDFSSMYYRLYELGMMPPIMKWPLILMRTLELTLMAPTNTDFLVHVPVDTSAAQGQMMATVESLQGLINSIWSERTQRVMFVQHVHVNTRRQIKESLDTKDQGTLQKLSKAMEYLAVEQLGLERATENGWFGDLKRWTEATKQAGPLGEMVDQMFVQGNAILFKDGGTKYPSRRDRLEKNWEMSPLTPGEMEDLRRLASGMNPCRQELITPTGRFRRAFPTL
jgi:hypothetical protein